MYRCVLWRNGSTSRRTRIVRRTVFDKNSTGDAVTAARRHKPDYQIALFMGLLMMLGLIIMYAIGPQRANVLNNSAGTDYTGIYFFIKQTVSIFLALAAFALTALVPYVFFRKHAKTILLIGFISCAVLAVAGWIGLGIAQCSLGACRWYDLGPLGSIQPAEFLKFGMLLFAAGFLGMRARQGLINDLHKTLIPMGVIALAAIVFVIGIQKDMGTGIALVAILAAMFVVAGLNLRTIGMLGLAILGLMVVMIVIAPHRMERITTFFQGDTASLNDSSNYHIVHAKIAIGSGGFLGVGIGNSVQATGYLPEAINDSVFAIMGETFGFVGLVVIILLFTGLLMRLLAVADHLEDMRLRLIVAGVFGWLGAHVILNIAAMIGIFPLTGITLPLLSFGGTSMIFIAGALGLAFQLSRYTNFSSRIKETDYEDSRSRRGVGRSRDTGRRRITNA
jgi:cell division protein FtsW